ncbi:hypothetical protein [Natronorubrum bangense]|uniref:Uncharacterized protein n=2 Tax=Natronorubrum bangense TaxID=61858 RepID=L9WEK4_9EURY|nr:hypothetical protein [Natronorubrum bangense]ELY47894.1 hypothetical protein C494_11860 [Natronorubrum bangense JCM 10635]QCC53639.1 hypothetical protein DV706_03545 [Natronorubrum bangense]
MTQFVWILVVSYIALGTGLVYGLAIGSPTLFLAAGGLFAVLAVSQRIVYSSADDRTPKPGPIPRDRT